MLFRFLTIRSRIGKDWGTVSFALFGFKYFWFKYPLPEDVHKLLITAAAWQLTDGGDPLLWGPCSQRTCWALPRALLWMGMKVLLQHRNRGTIPFNKWRTCRKQIDICIFSVLLLHIQQLTVLQKVKQMFQKSHRKFYLIIYGWNMN